MWGLDMILGLGLDYLFLATQLLVMVASDSNM